jgi:CxxC motif-containing protein (DUF1111 family)
LRQFVAAAFRNELGITNPLAPVDLAGHAGPGRGRCVGENEDIEDDGSLVDAVTAFLVALPAPAASIASGRGQALFARIGCDTCHTPSLPLADRGVPLYSDLLLHDLGPDLDDKVVQGQARRPRLAYDAPLGTGPALAPAPRRPGSLDRRGDSRARG